MVMASFRADREKKMHANEQISKKKDHRKHDSLNKDPFNGVILNAWYELFQILLLWSLNCIILYKRIVQLYPQKGDLNYLTLINISMFSYFKIKICYIFSPASPVSLSFQFNIWVSNIVLALYQSNLQATWGGIIPGSFVIIKRPSQKRLFTVTKIESYFSRASRTLWHCKRS